MSIGKKTRNPGWKPTGHWANCEVCDITYRHHELKRRWDGVLACPADFEVRNRQDHIKPVKDDSSPVGIHRPQSELEYDDITYSFATPSGLCAIVGLAVVGINVTCDDSSDLENPTVPTGTF